MWLNPDKFIVMEFFNRFFPERVNYVNMIETIGRRRQRYVFLQVEAEKFVQFAEAFVIPCKARIKMPVAISEMCP